MFTRSVVALSAAVVALTSPFVLVEAHQRVYFPEVIYTVADRGTNWGPQAKLESQGYKTTSDFNAYLKANGYKTLRAFMDKPGVYKPNSGATFECGFTNPNAPAQPIPTTGEFRTSGYTHEGPCEIWLGDTMIKHGDNCHFDIADKTFSDKIDYSACKGNCMLKWYWLGIRPMGKKYSWQIYKACIPLADKSGGATATTKKPTTTAPAATPKPATTTKAPETGKDDDAAPAPATTTKPAVTTTKPATTTAAPPVTTKPVSPPAAPATTKPATSKPVSCKRRRD